jgi:hypothetical protein
MKGLYQHCGKKHMAESDFRYSERAVLRVEDTERTIKVLCGIVGKAPDVSAD